MLTCWLVNKTVAYQFIDEKFHLGQTLTYLQNDWLIWDNKITTPPGLYILGYIWVNLFNWINSNWSKLTLTRLLNMFGGIVIFPLVTLRPLFLFNAIGFWPITLMCTPLMVTYYYLYYTDVWSTIFIIQSLTLALTLPFGERKSIWASAFCGGLSCLFRQTNIIWVGFILIITLERRAAITKQFNNYNFNNYIKLFIYSMEHLTDIVVPYSINFILFIIYLIWNKSITLGDKSNHSFSLHLVQFCYMTLFISFLSVPLWLSRNFILLYKLRFLTRPIRTIFEIFAIMLIIRYFTVVHPFLLADNRHYTFYLFKKIIGNNHKIIKYGLMASIYHFTLYSYMELLRPNELAFHYILPLPIKEPIELPLQLTHISWTALILCTLVTIVPSPLFEPRYYILPYFFWRLFITCNVEPIWRPLIIDKDSNIVVSSTNRLLWEFLWFMLVNIITFFIFINRTFSWDDEPFLQRIIW